MKILINEYFMENVEYDRIIHFDLRSDIEMENLVGCTLREEGYVGNRPTGFDEEYHEDDTWAIDCVTKDGFVAESYLYTSEFEYNQDIGILNRI